MIRAEAEGRAATDGVALVRVVDLDDDASTNMSSLNTRLGD